MARTLYIAGASGDEIVKPVPPSDLHARMELALRTLGDVTEPIPEDAWTRGWLEKNFYLSPNQAQRRIKKMLSSGEVRKAGKRGYDTYYMFTDAGQSKPGSKPGK